MILFCHFASTCSTYSGREGLAKQLQMEGISLSSWGNCSHRSPDREWEMIGRKKFFTDYRFYFAFENTFCDDYVSEKAFVALNFSRHYGVIPVVYGAAPYRSILPAGSFIDVSTFESVSALAKYMKSLALPENKMKLQSYYLWQYRYFTDQSDNSRVVLGKEEKYRFIYRDTLIVLVCLFFLGMQSLCQKLWDMDLNGELENKTSIVTNLRSRMGVCTY